MIRKCTLIAPASAARRAARGCYAADDGARGQGDTAAILLAAGRSRRMGGEDKLWVGLGARPTLAAVLARGDLG